jgi:hypothetical protein
MAKYILYHVNYNSEDGHIYGVYKDAIFEHKCDVFEAALALQNHHEKLTKHLRSDIKTRYKFAEAWKAGGWKAQSLALQDMLQNGGF